MTEYKYIYPWKNNEKRLRLYGKRFRLVVKGALNSALIEFEDGERVVTSCNALRRAAGFQMKLL